MFVIGVDSMQVMKFPSMIVRKEDMFGCGMICKCVAADLCHVDSSLGAPAKHMRHLVDNLLLCAQ